MRRGVPIAFVGLFALGAVLVVGGGLARPQTPLLTEPEQPVSATQPLPPPTYAEARCEATDLAYLIGRSRTEIPVPVDPSHRRVSCTTCPVTMDYMPDRTDILFDARTGLITEVKCG